MATTESKWRQKLGIDRLLAADSDGLTTATNDNWFYLGQESHLADKDLRGHTLGSGIGKGERGGGRWGTTEFNVPRAARRAWNGYMERNCIQPVPGVTR